MKTRTRRFITALFCAVCLITAMVVMPENVEGQVIITTFNGITPITINQATVNSIVNSMIAGNPSAGAWTYVPNGSSVNVAQVLSYNGSGYLVNCGVEITSTTPFY